jgi:hypothetical protein
MEQFATAPHAPLPVYREHDERVLDEIWRGER